MIPIEVTTKHIQSNKNKINEEHLDQENEQKFGQTFLQPLPQRPNHMIYRKTNDKNKFINKLRQFNSSTSDKITFRQTIPTVEGEQNPFDRRQRNKIAARSSRDRKKLYIKLMQTKIQNMELEISHTNSEIQKFRLQIYNLQMYQEGKQKQFKSRQIHISRKLEGLVNNSEIEDRNNEIDICLDSLIYRVGAVGNERKAALDRLYSNLINFSQPALYRYMLWSAAKQKHLFKNDSSKQDQEWGEQIQKIADACTLGKKEALARMRQRLSQKMVQIVHSSKRLDSVKKELQKSGQYLDNTIMGILRQILNPEQMALLILFTTRHQFKQQLLFDEKDEDQLGEGQRHPQKRVKMEQDSDCPILRVTQN